MPVSRSVPPQRSNAKLNATLRHLSALKAKHDRWMKLQPSSVIRNRVLYANPLYSIRLIDLIAGQPLSATLKRVAWMYFFRDSEKAVACAEVSIVGGAHMNARMSEGPFVKKTLGLIETVTKDPRTQRERFQLRSIRLDALHFFTLWLKAKNRTEYFVPVTPFRPLILAGKWYSRKELVDALLPEARRIVAAYRQMPRLSDKE